ncbi:MAG: hypothetical protein J6B89_01560 [Bacilli bacterium]|nr:hypothetical protein [Bacilli bacterium]
MSYINRCGDCEYYQMPRNKYDKGYCEYYNTYYYPEDSCNHQKPMTNVSTCYITTMVCNVLGLEDDCEVLLNLRSFRDNILQRNISYIPILMEYDTIGPEIAKSINEEYRETNDQTICKGMYNKFLVPTSEMIAAKNYQGAIRKYMEMVQVLKEYYGIQTPQQIIENYDNSQGGHGKIYTLKGLNG